MLFNETNMMKKPSMFQSIGINSHVHYVCHLDIYGQKTKKMFAVSGTQVLEGDMVNYD